MSVPASNVTPHASIALPPVHWLERTVPECQMAGTVLHSTAGRELYGEGEEARCFYKVISGVVRTCRVLSDGRRQIDDFYQAGDVFGFEFGTEHRWAAEAVTNCTVVAYRRRGLEAKMAEDNHLSRWFFDHALSCMTRTREHSLLLGRGTAAQKVAAFLLEMAERGDSDTVVELPMGRQDIADYLGLTIETVSRTLSQMERDRVVVLACPRRVVLKDRAALMNRS